MPAAQRSRQAWHADGVRRRRRLHVTRRAGRRADGAVRGITAADDHRARVRMRPAQLVVGGRRQSRGRPTSSRTSLATSRRYAAATRRACSSSPADCGRLHPMTRRPRCPPTSTTTAADLRRRRGEGGNSSDAMPAGNVSRIPRLSPYQGVQRRGLQRPDLRRQRREQLAQYLDHAEVIVLDDGAARTQRGADTDVPQTSVPATKRCIRALDDGTIGFKKLRLRDRKLAWRPTWPGVMVTMLKPCRPTEVCCRCWVARRCAVSPCGDNYPYANNR